MGVSVQSLPMYHPESTKKPELRSYFDGVGWHVDGLQNLIIYTEDQVHPIAQYAAGTWWSVELFDVES